MNSNALIPMETKLCKVCLHDDQENMVKLVSDGIISHDDAAKRLGCSKPTWYKHLKFCVRSAVETAIAPNVDEISKRVIDNVFELIDQIERTKSLTGKIHSVLENSGSDLDPKQLQSYVMLEKQLSHTLELYSKITGDLQNSAVINVNNTKIEFNDFRGKVMDTVCRTCRRRIAEMDDEGQLESADEEIESSREDRRKARELERVVDSYGLRGEFQKMERGEIGVSIEEIMANGEDAEDIKGDDED